MEQVVTLRLKLKPPTKHKSERLQQQQVAYIQACRYFAEVSRSLGSTGLGKVNRASYQESKGLFALNTGVLQQAMQKALSARRSVLSRLRKGKKASEPNFKRVPVMYRQDLYRVVEIGSGFGLKLPTASGRSVMTFPVEVGKYQRRLLTLLASGGARQGSGELFQGRSGSWYFHLTLKIPCDVQEPNTVIGVDLGVVKVATLSNPDGSLNQFYNGKPLRWRRERRAERRGKLQEKGRMKRVKREKGKETRWMTYHNHVISKEIVKEASDRKAMIVLEELAGIRDRSKLGKRGNRMISSWTFRQLISFIEYKAALARIPVCFIDPRGTSKTCSRCGASEKGNRQTQANFRCRSCGYRVNADLNAARNIAAIGSMAWGQDPQVNGSVAPRMAQGGTCSVQADLSTSRLRSPRL